MKFDEMSDNDLLLNTKKLVKEETTLTAKIIDHLAEIDRRRLYSDLEHESLFVYGVKELKYSEDQISRRINALRLTRKVPLAKDKIDKGTLSLTNANLLSGFFNDLELAADEQNRVVELVSNRSKNECKDILMEIKEEKGHTPRPRKPTVKIETSTTIRLSITLKKETMKKIEVIRGMYAHKKLSLEEVVDLMAENIISNKREELTPKRKGKKEGKGRYIPKEVKKEAMERAGYKCEQCGSTYALQYEHCLPYSIGGKSISSNIKILCRNCNLRNGIKTFGVKKMDKIKTEQLELGLHKR